MLEALKLIRCKIGDARDNQAILRPAAEVEAFVLLRSWQIAQIGPLGPHVDGHHVSPCSIDEHRDRAATDNVDAPAFEREAIARKFFDRWREIHLPTEPRSNGGVIPRLD